MSYSAVQDTGLVLVARNLAKSYTQGDANVPVLSELNFALKKGQMTAVVGPSGSGKSTLLNILGLLTAPDSGQLVLDGYDVADLSPSERAAFRLGKIAFVFQAFHLVEHKTVFENIELPLIYAGVKRSVRNLEVQAMLEKMGMAHRSGSLPATLSGGEKQRVAIGRALVTKPMIMLCDEPTGSLDSNRSRDVLQLLRELTGPEQATVIVTHDAWVAEQCDGSISLADGKIIAKGDVEERPQDVNPQTYRVSRSGKLRWIRLGMIEAINAVRHRFRRNVFTMLGVALGVACLVLTVGLSATISSQLSDRFDLFLAQRVTLTPPGDGQISTQRALEWEGSEAMSRLVDLNGVEAAGVQQDVSDGAATVSLSPENRTDFPGRIQAPIIATSANGLLSQGISLSDGRLFDAGHMERSDRVALVGESLMSSLGRDWEPGISIFVGNQDFRLIGTVEEDLTSAANTASVYIPLGQSLAGSSGDLAPTKILLKTRPGAASQVATEAGLAWDAANPQQLAATAPPEPERLREAVDSQQQSLLLGMASVTLVIGGVGIMNTFLVAVLERRREIGLRLALGSPPIGMLAQFGTESILTSIVGACVGVLGAINVLAALSLLNGWVPVISLQSIALGLGAGVLLGVIAGVHPARKASRVDPVDTLSHN